MYRLLDPLYFYCKERLSILEDLRIPSEVVNHYEHACAADDQIQKSATHLLDRKSFHKIAEHACVIATPCSTNYFHWFEDALKVAQFELCGFDGVYVITEDLPAFCFETLELLRIPKDRFLIASENLALENSYVCNRSHFVNCNERQHLVNWLRTQLFEQLQDKHRGAGRIYLQRSGSRQVVNEAEVI